MIVEAKSLSAEQRTVVESLVGRAIADSDSVSVRVMSSDSAPDWLRRSWDSAERAGLDSMTPEEIDAEIAAVRKARKSRT